MTENKGRVLGVDYGDRRTGLAISDVNRFLAGGIGTISEGGMRATAKKVAEGGASDSQSDRHARREAQGRGGHAVGRDHFAELPRSRKEHVNSSLKFSVISVRCHTIVTMAGYTVSTNGKRGQNHG